MANGGAAQSGSRADGRSSGHRSWRASSRADGPQHQWQHANGRSRSLLGLARGSHTTRVTFFFLAAGILAGLLVWHLLFAPAQTPLLAVALTAYEWPLPPNSWAAEDVAALNDLDHKTLELHDLSADWRSTDRGLTKFDEELHKSIRSAQRAGAIIFYLSVHGAIDGQGRACLVPPDANPQDSATWLPVESLLERLKNAKMPARVHKLLILDCCRQPINWQIGEVGGAFVTAVSKSIEVTPIPGLVVMCSTSDSETAVASPALRGSAFGHYLHLGLAGAADDSDAEGNNDGRVTLHELRHYVTAHVHGWVLHHLGVPQTPVMIGSKSDFEVSWSLKASVWRDLVARSQRKEIATASVSTERSAPLWRTLDGLRAARPWRFDPVGWRNFEHRLLWLEQLAVAGKAYDERASSLAAQLNGELSTAEEKLKAASRTRSLPAYANVLSTAGETAPLKPHSLPLSEFWGQVDSDVLIGLRQSLARCQESPTTNNLSVAISAFEGASLPASMDETNFLAIWRRSFVPQQWASSKLLAEVLQARESAEQQAVPAASGSGPGDERAHAWVRADLASMDQQRRALEDAILVGPGRAAPGSASELVQSLASDTLGQRSSKAIAARDELWATVPYFAEWLCRPQFEAAPEKIANDAIRQTLLPLLQAGLELEQRLMRNDGQAADELIWSADSAADLVERKSAEANTLLQAAIDAALEDTDQNSGTREIDALLAIPTLRWETRQRLLHQRLELHLRQAARYDGPFDGAAKPVPSATAAGPHAERAARWSPHPLLLLAAEHPTTSVANSETAEDAIDRCSQIGAEVRQRLRALVAGSGVTAISPTATVFAKNNYAGSIGALCIAESQLRRAAGLWFPRPGLDAVRELRRADLQEFFIWRSQRALDDLYGPAAAGQEPFFATSAADYLAAARALGPLSEVASKRFTQTEDLLAARRIAVRESLAVSATDILLAEQASSVQSELAVKVRTPEAAASLPTASAAVFLADKIGRIDGTSTALEVPATDRHAGDSLLTEQRTLDTATLAERGPLLSALISLRGNDIAAPVLLRAPGGVQVSFQQPVYGPPKVTVLGHDRKQASVVFILDCSHSMQEQAATESPDGTGGDRSSRMELAKRSLNMLLADLSDRGTLRVGVRAFGHRVGWSTTENGKLLRQTAYQDEIPADLRPYADVELILPLGRFDSIAAGRVSDKLQSVRAWGESPIYLALQHAIGDFRSDDNAARSIVLITDGQNYQFNPPRESQPQLNEVLSAAERAKIAIHVVGFAMNDADARSVAAEFSQMATRTGGSYVPAASATALLDSLQRLLAPGEFRVADANGSVLAAAELGQSVTLMNQRGRRRYQVGFEHLRESVELAGGEGAELVVRRGEQRMEVVPYLAGSPRFQPLVTHDDSAATRFNAGIHRSVRTPDGIQFPISIQPADGHFVPRPIEMWTEVLPLGVPAEVSSGPYIFYDAAFLPGTSVPVANLLARGWPSGVTKAEVRVWIKDSLSTPCEERPLTEVADRLPEEGGGFTIAGNPGVRYQVRTSSGSGDSLLVGLVERHDRADTVGSLKVTLSPAPAGATHQFDPQNRVALHTFELSGSTADRARISIHFTKRDSAQAHSLRTSQPVIVDVADRADVLELTPQN
jgi:hypothetical protein